MPLTCRSEDVVEHRHATYRPASRWRRVRGRGRLFRSVQLNLAGWAAVMAMCLAGAGAGYVVGRLVDVPAALGLTAGALAVLAGLLVVDRRRWARLNRAP